MRGASKNRPGQLNELLDLNLFDQGWEFDCLLEHRTFCGAKLYMSERYEQLEMPFTLVKNSVFISRNCKCK